MHKRRNATIFILIVVLAAVGGWLLGRQVASPAEIAAQTAEPTPSPILAPVEVRALSTDVVTRGTGRFGSPKEVSLPATALKREQLVITSAPGVGTAVDEGDLLMTVSGRPVIVLRGDVPSFRDIGVGSVGVDVAQLEQALDRLGLLAGGPDDRFDDATAIAVATLFSQQGHSPLSADAEQLAELLPASDALAPGGIPEAGLIVPADELLFIPSLPARVADTAVRPGDPVDGPLLTLTDTDVAIDASLPIEQSSLVVPGMVVRIDEPDLGIEASGVVSVVAEAPGTNGLDGFHVYFEVTVAEPPANLVNASVRLTIPVESTSEDVLVVPVAALSLAPDGSSVVQIDRAGALESIEVRPGLSAQGFVAVNPVGATFAAGDMVLIGFERGAR